MEKLPAPSIRNRQKLPNLCRAERGKTAPKDMEKTDWKRLLKRFGIAGFLFFLAKGLVWLAIIFGAGNLICS